MKSKVNSFIYFLSSRLQISSAEKTTVLTLGMLLLLISGGQQFLSAGAARAYEAPYYSERIAVFETKAQQTARELAGLQQQYYPETSAVASQPEPQAPLPAAEPETDDAEPADSLQEAPEATDKININTATSAQLETLPGIGPAIAGRIIEHRNTHGPFQRIEDIKNVRGIAEGRFSKIKELITVGESESD